MPKKNVAQLLADAVAAENVKFAFGVPGGQIISFCQALFDTPTRFILARHEQCAAYMADAYTRLTGEASLCLATVGPGATNLVTGLYLAHTDSRPVVAFTGQTPASHSGKGTMQECDHLTLFKSLTKWGTSLEDPRRTYELAQRAFRTAVTSRPGPTHLDLPVDVLDMPTSEQEQTHPLRPIDEKPCGVPMPDPEAVAAAASLLADAVRPVVLVGGGGNYTDRRASDKLVALAEHLAAPVATTLNGVGVMPGDHPQSMGRVGMHSPPFANEFLEKADVILAIGCRFSSTGTNNYTNIGSTTRIIQIDLDPEQIAKNYPVAVGIVADARAALHAILTKLNGRSLDNGQRREHLSRVQAAKARWEAEWEPLATSGAVPVKPQRLARDTRRFWPRNTIFTVDAGNVHFWPSYEPVYEPGTWIQSGAGAPMGYALPAAITCKLVQPDRPVVAIIGDGGFAMTCQELWTAAQHKTGITVMITDDSALGYIRHLEQVACGGRVLASELRNPDFAAFARSAKCLGETVSDPADLPGAIERASRANADGVPAVIDVQIDPTEKLIDFEKLYGPKTEVRA